MLIGNCEVRILGRPRVQSGLNREGPWRLPFGGLLPDSVESTFTKNNLASMQLRGIVLVTKGSHKPLYVGSSPTPATTYFAPPLYAICKPF